MQKLVSQIEGYLNIIVTMVETGQALSPYKQCLLNQYVVP